MTLQPNEFRCAACGGIFTKTASESEVVAEYERYFGTFRPAEVAVVCDDCFNRMHPETHPHEVEKAMAEHARERGKQQGGDTP